MVLVHGYPFDHRMWLEVRECLPSRVDVIAPDLPGFGGEATLEDEPSIEAMAGCLAQRLEGRPRFMLAGFSMGGYVSLALAERSPERIAALVLINSQPFADTDEVRAGRRAMIEKIKKRGWQAAAEAAMPKLFAPRNADNATLRTAVEAGAQAAGVAGLTWALEAMARRPDRTAVLRSLRVPLAIIHSQQDQFIPVERIRELAKSIPSARYIEIPEAGHCTPLEGAGQIAEVLTEIDSTVNPLP